MVIRSAQFDDVYFSVHDGLEESRHVFLAGNNLPQAWQEQDVFTILETGFGTGLNFITAWIDFEKSAKSYQHLHFISCEKYPLTPHEIRQALSAWPELSIYVDKMLRHYPLRVGGWHRLQITPTIHLTLIFDDVNNALPELDAEIDAIFLDGFAPAKNPEMWSETLFDQLARLSHKATTVATFSAARVVRDGLARAGFTTLKIKGFGHKRDMIKATSNHVRAKQVLAHKNRSIGIIGAGLAGAAAAYTLQKQGHQVVVYETNAMPASGASGNPVGLYNPRFTAQRGPEAEFYMSAFAKAYDTFRYFDDVDFDPSGALHLINDDEKAKRFYSLVQTWGWYSDHLQILDEAEVGQRVGFDLGKKALWLPQSGTISPRKLVSRYLQNCDVRYNAKIEHQSLQHDVIILANAQTVNDLPIKSVRGQVTFAKAQYDLPMKTNLCYGGYCTMAKDGQHILGSTFQPWITETTLRDEDHAQNIQTFENNVPNLKGKLHVIGGRASLRMSSQDRFPVIGQLQDNTYVSLAHGSHGLLSSLMGAQILADQVSRFMTGMPRKTRLALDPARFERRKKSKN